LRQGTWRNTAVDCTYVQTDEIQNQGEWVSVVVYGEYEELPEPQYRAERKLAGSLQRRDSC